MTEDWKDDLEDFVKICQSFVTQRKLDFFNVSRPSKYSSKERTASFCSSLRSIIDNMEEIYNDLIDSKTWDQAVTFFNKFNRVSEPASRLVCAYFNGVCFGKVTKLL